MIVIVIIIVVIVIVIVVVVVVIGVSARIVPSNDGNFIEAAVVYSQLSKHGGWAVEIGVSWEACCAGLATMLLLAVFVVVIVTVVMIGVTNVVVVVLLLVIVLVVALVVDAVAVVAAAYHAYSTGVSARIMLIVAGVCIYSHGFLLESNHI